MPVGWRSLHLAVIVRVAGWSLRQLCRMTRCGTASLVLQPSYRSKVFQEVCRKCEVSWAADRPPEFSALSEWSRWCTTGPMVPPKCHDARPEYQFGRSSPPSRSVSSPSKAISIPEGGEGAPLPPQHVASMQRTLQWDERIVALPSCAAEPATPCFPTEAGFLPRSNSVSSSEVMLPAGLFVFGVASSEIPNAASRCW